MDLEAVQRRLDVDEPTEDDYRLALELMRTTDPRVRDWACFTLGSVWTELDTPHLRDAFIARLHDRDTDTRCEALVGLARRRDDRVLPYIAAALSRRNRSVWRLEMIAAGILGDTSLHPLVLAQLDGWEGDNVQTMDAVRRLTDPDGPGDDLLSGVGELYRRRAHGLPDGDALASWHLMDEMLDLAPWRAREFFTGALARLEDDEAAQHQLRHQSRLAQLADDAG